MRAGKTFAVSTFCVVAAGVAPVFLTASPLIVAGVTIIAGFVPALIDLAHAKRGNTPGSDPSNRTRSTAGVTSLAVVLLVIITVGGGAAYTVSYGVARVTGNETVEVQRMSQQASGRAGPLRVTVESVGITGHYTKVEMVAVNGGKAPVRIQLFGSAQFIDKGDSVLDTLISVGNDSGFDVPAGGVQVKKVLKLLAMG